MPAPGKVDMAEKYAQIELMSLPFQDGVMSNLNLPSNVLKENSQIDAERAGWLQRRPTKTSEEQQQLW